jgi:predicted transcriptional regulator
MTHQALLNSKSAKAAQAKLRAISGLSRYRILLIMHNEGVPMRVLDLANTLHSSASKISHQMRILRQHGLVRNSENGNGKEQRT